MNVINVAKIEPLNINNEIDYNLLVDTAILVGEIMLKNGAETHIVELKMNKLLETTSMKHIETVVMTTSIIVTLSDPSIEHITAVSRIHERTTNLNRVNTTSNLIDDYCNEIINLEELFHKLKHLKTYNQYSQLFKNLCLIPVPPACTLILGGTNIDAISSTICGVIISILTVLFRFIKINDFIKVTSIVMIASFISVCLSKLIGSNVDSVVVGFIMPYLPGIAITNAVRDTFSADYMSGAARLLDAIVQAIAVALGVYLGLFIYNLVIGGIRI